MKPIRKKHRIPFFTDLVDIPKMVRDPLGFCEEMINTYGEVSYVPIMGVENYFIQDPEVLQEMLTKHASAFQKSRLYKAMRLFLGHGLLTSDGDYHKKQRKLITPMFLKESIHEYAAIMVNVTLEEMSTWKKGDKINVSQACRSIALKIVAQTLFNAKITRQQTAQTAKQVSDLLDIVGQIFQNPILLFCLEKNIRIPIVKKFYTLKGALDVVINDIITQYRSSHSVHRDLLSLLMNAKDEETGEMMSDEQIRDEVITLFLAGHETTATGLSWTWYLLGKHTDKAEKFYSEVRQVITDRLLNADDYNTLNYTRLVFKESLRLYPPVWTLAREATQDVAISGYQFPKGAVLCSVFTHIHRNPRYYKNPLDFIPERWNDPEINNNPKLSYVPFGSGNRMCIGQGFAWMEAVMILGTMASRFQFVLPDDFSTKEKIGFTLKPEKEIECMLV